MDDEIVIQLQSRILCSNITDLKDFGLKMKWLNVETTEGKGKFELIKIIRTAFEDERGKLDLVAKNEVILDMSLPHRNRTAKLSTMTN